MLIKNSRGDWGIVTAFWEGYKKAVRGMKMKNFIDLPLF